ncbi:MAG: hypothetical protein KUG80_01695 [Gammaproteobacteria bacterium]|nr:hypothetical protein [Gammaproteobacteria bacterium]
MITYFYWFVLITLSIVAFLVLNSQSKNIKISAIISIAILFTGSILYYFNLQQVFVKHWGGTMHITVPNGQQHIQATWKDDNLWIENYKPQNNTCIFTEYSRGNLLEGKVIIKNCNPLK